MQLVKQQQYWLRPPQAEIFVDRHRHRVLVAGRRFGKTFLALMILIEAASRFARSKNWYVCPTRTMAEDIAWEELKFILNVDDFGLGNKKVLWTSESDLTVKFTNGAVISLKGAAEPDRLRGRGLKTVVLDEFADMDPKAWVVLRPQLSDERMRLAYGELGRAVFIGTPKGYNHFKKMVDEIVIGKMGKAWGAWHFTTIEGQNVSTKEVESAKYDLTDRDYRQEYLATFESIQGRIYHAFLRKLYDQNAPGCGGNLDVSIKDPGPGLPLSIGMDFNVNPMTATVSSYLEMERPYLPRDNGKQYELHTWKEYVLHNSGTAEMMQAIRADYPERHLMVYPDPTGASRSTKTANVGETDHSIIKSFGADLFIPKFNTNSDKYNTVNGLLCNTLGMRRALINPLTCPNLVDALDGLQYKDGTNLPDKASGLDHITDAYSYSVLSLFPIATGYTQISTVAM